MQRDGKERHGTGGHEWNDKGWDTVRYGYDAEQYGTVWYEMEPVRQGTKREGTSRSTWYGMERYGKKVNGMVRHDQHGTVQYGTERREN